MNDWNFEENWMPRHRFTHRHSRTRPVLLRKTLLGIAQDYRIIQYVDHAQQHVGDLYLSITKDAKETKVYTVNAILERVKKDLPLKEYLIAEKFFMERVI